jgi:hypothetical protein
MKDKSKLALMGSAVVLGLAILGLGIGTTVMAASDDTSQLTSTTSVVSASDVTDNQTNPHDIFVGKVAEKLGLDEETVAAAMDEAREEMRQEAMEKRLQEAVDNGVITQEQADEILAWMESRPAALDELGGFGPAFGPGGEGGGRMIGPHGRGPL